MPSGHQATGQHQVRHAARKRRIRRLLALANQIIHRLHKRLTRALQSLGHGQRLRLGAGAQFLFGVGNLLGERTRRGTTVAQGFASQQIVGLNRSGAFVDGQYTRVAVVLRGAGFFDKPHAAVHLHAQRCNFKAHLGAEPLDQRHHEFIKGLVCLAHLRVGVGVRHVKGTRGGKRHGATAFGERTHGHEHALDVWVVHDGHRRLGRSIHRTALHAIARVAHGLLIRPLGNGNALDPHGKARRVHHDEHVLQATVFLAHQIAHGAAFVAVLQHRGGAGFDAQLMLDADTAHVVALAQRTVGVHQHLGHHKQADALNPLGCTADPSQHQVHDVVGVIVFTVGDINFGAKHAVAAVGLGFGTRAQRRQIGAGLRFG